MSDQVQAELMRLRDVTVRTGTVHEAQALQLKMWAALMSPRKGSFEVRVDSAERTIEFLFRKLTPKYTKQAPVLGRSVRWLLGGGWVVRVKSAGKAIFTGRKTAKDEPSDHVQIYDHTGQVVVVPKPTEPKEIVPWRDRLHLSQFPATPTPSSTSGSGTPSISTSSAATPRSPRP